MRSFSLTARTLVLAAVSCIPIALSAPLLSAQTRVPAVPPTLPAEPAVAEGLRYRFVGHSVGGRVNAVAGVPSQPNTFFMGVASGGLFRTTNGGQSWEPISDGQIPVGSIGAISVADSDPAIMYVGTGADGARSNVSTGRGVYKSTNAGTTWQFAGLYQVGQIGAVRIHPTNADIVWVSATGDVFKKNRDRGIFKTTDGGKTWRKTLYLNDSTGASDVELMPGNPDVVYAWMARLERKPWTIISGSREGGFYKSTDGGVTFKKTGTGLPTGLIGKGNLAVTAANPQRIYLLVEAEPGGGLYRSDNAGATWEQVNKTPGLITRPFYYTTIGADPTNADVVYAGAETFYKSTDGGKTVTPFRTPHTDNHDIWINPTNGQIMVQANDGGANVSFDGGKTWSTQMNQPTAEFYGVWPDTQFPYNLYSAQQDNSTWVMSSVGNPFDVASLRTGPGCETGPIIPHPSEPNIIYGSCKGQFSVMNTETRQSRNYWIGGQSLYGNAGQDLIYRIQRVAPMALSPYDPNVLYYGTQYVHVTRDKGVTWERISPDLTAFPSCCQGASGEPITRDVTGEEFYSTLYAITESPHERGVIWTGANDGPFHITRDGGKTWSNITPNDLPSGGRVAWIDASPHRPGSAYYAVYRYLLGDYEPYIYRTDDYGKSWTRLTNGRNGIPADWPARVVREDPDREGLLYAGTEFGMFISFNNGTTWQSFQRNLPQVPVQQILVHKKDLIVTTQGRGTWIMDNVSALHQTAATTASTPLTVFTPRHGYRTTTGALYVGPQIDYFLSVTPTDTVRIDIRDAAGRVVNRYKSGVRPPAAPRARRVDPDDPDAVMMEGRDGMTPYATFAPTLDSVPASVGMNRFTWSVRHENGFGAPPGSYSVTVSVGNHTQTVPLTVLIGPRLAAEGMTAADLQEQFDHNVRMRAMTAEVNALIARVREAETRLKAEGAPAAETLAAVQAVGKLLLTEPVRYGKPGLQAHITYLASMTTRVDQKVGRDALERHDVLRRALDEATAQLNRAVGTRSAP
jgi:photosystem II stability/assembly factor-like uncharacterized protein